MTEIRGRVRDSVDLPLEEYFEIYNASNKILQLEDVRISNGTTTRTLPEYLLYPEVYLALTEVDSVALFQPFGEVLGVNSFPSITDSGDEIILTSPTDEVIFALTFDDDWYSDREKSDNGYSLELVFLEGPYDCPGNWDASEAEEGGTPGQINALFGNPIDNEGPVYQQFGIEFGNSIRLVFDEPLDLATVENLGNYSIDNGLNVADAILSGESNEEVLLVLDSPLASGIGYTLVVEGVSDCIGNPMPSPVRLLIGLEEALDQEADRRKNGIAHRGSSLFLREGL